VKKITDLPICDLCKFTLVNCKETRTTWKNVILLNHQSWAVLWDDVVQTQTLKHTCIAGALIRPQKTSSWSCIPFSGFTATNNTNL